MILVDWLSTIFSLWIHILLFSRFNGRTTSSGMDLGSLWHAVVEKLLKVGSHVKNSRLFRRILHTEKKMELRKEPMSYSRANELIKRELQKEELDPKLYGVYGLRAWGASSAAALGVPDRLFQRQGGWRSERSKNKYIQESTESLLTVTKTIQAWELIRHLWLNFHLVQIYQT